MASRTERRWAERDRLVGDGRGLFETVAEHVDATSVLHPGSDADIAPSSVWPDATDVDAWAPRCFDEDGARTIVGRQPGARAVPVVRFVAADSTEPSPLSVEGFDLLVSPYAGVFRRIR